MGKLLHMVQQGGDWVGPQLAKALRAVPNVTAHPSTASVPTTVLLYNGPLLCGFNVGIKGLISLICKQNTTNKSGQQTSPNAALQGAAPCKPNSTIPGIFASLTWILTVKPPTCSGKETERQ